MELAKSSSTNIDKLWNYFKTNLLKTVDENVPFKMTRPNKSSPWINRKGYVHYFWAILEPLRGQKNDFHTFLLIINLLEK